MTLSFCGPHFNMHQKQRVYLQCVFGVINAIKQISTLSRTVQTSATTAAATDGINHSHAKQSLSAMSIPYTTGHCQYT